MTSARRQRRVVQKKRAQAIPLFKYLLLIFIPVILFFGIKFNTKHWNGEDNMSFVLKSEEGQVGVVVLDPKFEDMTVITIPGETEVAVARNYGTIRIKNVWQLGINEKTGGSLLSETVTQNFLFPVSLWSDSDGAALLNPKLPSLMKFVFLPKNTNIPFGDRLSVSLFVLRVGDLNKNEIDMAKSQFLKKEKLNDGEVGYRLLTTPGRLTVYFSDKNFVVKNPRIYITDATGETFSSKLMGEILEVMGGKVVSIDKKAVLPEIDCVVRAKDEKMAIKIKEIFSCNIDNGNPEFDLEITLGGGFAKRF